MKKIFLLAALAITLAACNKADVRPVEKNDGMITLTAPLAPKGAATKALAEDGGKLKASWAVDETLAILYNLSGINYSAVATVKSVDASGAATIEFDVEAATVAGTLCTVIYPASAADNASGVQGNAELLGNQPGTLDDNLDIRVTTGIIDPVTPAAGLVLDDPLLPKFAIVKFSLQDAASNPLSAKSLAVTIGNDAFVATPPSAASEFYLALPAVSGGTLIFSVPGNEGISSYRSSKTSLTIEAGKYYRSTVQMTMQSDDANYVPMGDGKKWALKNVGAANPEDYGDYFAWGETTPYYQEGYSQESPMDADHWKSGKSGYNWANYAFTADKGSTFTKYCPRNKNPMIENKYWGGGGKPDNLLVLQAADDAATQAWRKSWRMPTSSEWEALLATSDFTWAWVTNFNGSGNNGRLVISRKSGFEGSCIFLPAAGYREHDYLNNTGYYGYYWSSSLRTNSRGYPGDAFALLFYSGSAPLKPNGRFYGQSVRPVTN